jgi:hypothetical protein
MPSKVSCEVAAQPGREQIMIESDHPLLPHKYSLLHLKSQHGCALGYTLNGDWG